MAKVMLKRVGILSVAKWQALLMFLFGLLSGLYQWVVLLISHQSDRHYAIAYVVVYPIAWAIMAFVAAALGGLIYNALAGSVGGMVLYLEDTETEFLPPPPPTEFLNLS
jgi:hypothetical protein